jgi:hypothetical protein
MEVMSPGSKALQTYMTNRLLVYMAREFRTFEKRHLLPCIRADELPGQFPYLSEAIIRKKLREHANLQVIMNVRDFLIKFLIGCSTNIHVLLQMHMHRSRKDQMVSGFGLRSAISAFGRRMN